MSKLFLRAFTGSLTQSILFNGEEIPNLGCRLCEYGTGRGDACALLIGMSEINNFASNFGLEIPPSELKDLWRNGSFPGKGD